MVSKLTLTYNGETKNLITGDFKMKTNTTKWSSKKAHNLVGLAYEAHASEVQTFVPEELNFECLMEDVDLDGFKHFARKENAKFRLDIIKDEQNYYCYAYMTGDENDYFAPSEVNIYTIKFLRTSMFFKEKVYTLDIQDAVLGKGYPYEYPLEYIAYNNTYESSLLEVVNEGECNAPVRMELICDELPPRVGVNKRGDYTINSYIAEGIKPANYETIINSSLPSEFKIVKVLNNEEISIDQHRKWAGSKGYIYMPTGKSKLFFNYVMKGRVVLYECYYNI